MIIEKEVRPMFHVSRRDLGETITLIPKVPINATIGECQDTPRVCFAPSVTQCVIGLIGRGIRRRNRTGYLHQ